MTAECRIAALESAIPAGDACPISPFGVGMTTASRGLHFWQYRVSRPQCKEVLTLDDMQTEVLEGPDIHQQQDDAVVAVDNSTAEYRHVGRFAQAAACYQAQVTIDLR